MMTQIQLLFGLLTSLLTLSSGLNAQAQIPGDRSSSDIQFACGQSFDRNTQQYVFTTFAWNSKHKKPIITWKQETFSDAGFDPQKRCETVSPKFQEAYANQSLKFLTHGTINGQPVICTSSLLGEDCQTLLITLLPEDDPLQTLEQLSNIFLGYANSPLEQSSAESIHEVGDRVYVEVDIEEFLNQ